MPVVEISVNGKPLDLARPARFPWMNYYALYRFIRPKWRSLRGQHGKVKIYTKEEIENYMFQRGVST